jgi:hypothetical protein
MKRRLPPENAHRTAVSRPPNPSAHKCGHRMKQRLKRRFLWGVFRFCWWWRRTLEAMRSGSPLIYSGRLSAGDLLGVPDLLRREGPG